MFQLGGAKLLLTFLRCGTRIGTRISNANKERETEIGIGIMLAAVVVVAAEDITIPMRFMVRIIIVRVVVKGMGGHLMNDGGDCWTPTLGHFFRRHIFVLFIVQCTYFLDICFYDNTDLLSLSSTAINSTH